MTLNRPHPDPLVQQEHRLSGCVFVLIITGAALISDALSSMTGVSFFVVIALAVRAIVNAIDAAFELSHLKRNPPPIIRVDCDEFLCQPELHPDHYDRQGRHYLRKGKEGES